MTSSNSGKIGNLPGGDSPPSVSITTIRKALAGAPPDDGLAGGRSGVDAAGTRVAAVALVFAGDERAPALCVIRRAQREGDPWSGHMAFPGGKADPADISPRAAAQREALEEVGLRLEDRHYLAPLARTPVRAGGVDVGIELFPFVYYLGPETARLKPNGEVAEAFWVPLAHILDARNQVEMPLRRDGQLLKFPSISYGGHHIWGITYRVLMQFGEAVGRPLPGPEHHP